MLILSIVAYGCETWSLTLYKVLTLVIFENTVLRIIFGPKREELVGGWRCLHKEKRNNLCASPNIMGGDIKKDEMHGTCNKNGRDENIYSILVGKPCRKKTTQKI